MNYATTEMSDRHLDTRSRVAKAVNTGFERFRVDTPSGREAFSKFIQAVATWTPTIVLDAMQLDQAERDEILARELSRCGGADVKQAMSGAEEGEE